MGTIPERLIEQRMSARQARLVRCFQSRMQQLEFLAGSMELHFRVDSEGRVTRVGPHRSTVGDRETELCMLAVAQSTRFPRPSGGNAAEFTWSFEVEVSEDVRAPVTWQQVRVSDSIKEHRSELSTCPGCSGCELTAYVAPGGRVMAVGAAARRPIGERAFDCVVRSVASWRLPDPGSYPAKVTFRLP